MKKIGLTLFIFPLCISINIFSQINFRLRAELGASGTSKFSSVVNSETITPLLSGSFHSLIRIALWKNLNFETGIGLINLNSKQEIVTPNPDPANIYSTGPTFSERKYYLYYLSLPLFINLTYNKFDISLGVRPAFCFRKKYKMHSIGEILYEPYDVVVKNQNFDITSFDFSGGINFGYLIANKWMLSLSGYHSITKVKFKGSSSGFYNYQVSCGVSYFVK